MKEAGFLRRFGRATMSTLHPGRRSWTERYLDDLARQGTWTFIHVNKCGGTSVEHALDIPKTHDTALTRRARLGPERWQTLTSFAIVRHPYARVRSLYKYRIKTDRTSMADGHIPLEDWITAVFEAHDPSYYDKPLMFAPARDWLADETGQVIVDLVAKLETIDSDWPRIAAAIGRPDVRLARMNTTPPSAASETLSPRARALLQAHFQADFETFDYDP